MSNKVINESYEIKRVQTMIAACLGATVHWMGGKVEWYPGAWDPKVYSKFLNGDEWRKDSQDIYYHHDPHDHRKTERVAFKNVFYGPESDWEDGKPTLLKKAELRDDGKSKVFDNRKGANTFHAAYEDEITLENSISTHVSSTLNLDVTTSSETKVSGEFPGGALEETIKTELHVGDTEEDARDEAENKSDSEKTALEFDVDPGQCVLLAINKDQQIESIPRKGVFVIDGAIDVQLYHWWQHGTGHGGTEFREKGSDHYTFGNLADLEQFFHGTNTDYPSAAGLWDAAPTRVKNGVLHLLKPENRSYDLDGVAIRTLESNVDYTTTDIKDPSDPSANGLPVVDVSDEKQGAAYAA